MYLCVAAVEGDAGLGGILLQLVISSRPVILLVNRVSDPDPYPDPHGSALI
jgi:hypothetical protein